MAPKPVPRVEDFVSFHGRNASIQGFDGTCIYYLVDKGRRCKIPISVPDGNRALSLRSEIEQNQEPSLNDLREYARVNCCTRWHQTRIEDYSLAAALAQRWQTEILSTRDAVPFQRNGGSENRGNVRPTMTPTTSDLHWTESTDQPARYNLRSRTNTQLSSRSTNTDRSSDGSSSGFRPHVRSPNADVVSKLWKPLGRKRDRESGTLYLFKRASSPGFVKIGVTGASIRSRFSSLSQACHYTPELLRDFNDVPHVYRVETLIHFELIQHWRVERRCRGCNSQHKEWFEIVDEHAIEIAGQWVQWMKEAKPYDQDGILTMTWRDHLRQLQAEGVPVTAKVLLEIHRASQLASTALQTMEDSVSMPPTSLESNMLNIAHVAVVLQFVLTHLEQVQIQQALEQTYRSFRRSTSMVSQSPVTSFTGGELLRRDTNMSIASQA